MIENHEMKLGCRPVAELAILLCCPSWHLCQAVKYPPGLPGFFYKQTKDIRHTKIGKYEYRQPTRKCWYSGVCMLVCPDPPDIFSYSNIQ